MYFCGFVPYIELQPVKGGNMAKSAKPKTEKVAEPVVAEEVKTETSAAVEDNSAADASETSSEAPEENSDTDAQSDGDDASADRPGDEDGALEEDGDDKPAAVYVHPVTGQALRDPSRPFNADNPVMTAVVL